MELVVVIILLGILAATALPRFINTAPEARIAALEGLRGSLLSGASMANAECRLTSGCFVSGWTSVNITSPDGQTGQFYNGYPTSNATAAASHITRWVNVTGFNIDTSSVLQTDFSPDGVPDPTTCFARYAYAQNFGDAPAVTLTTAGC